MQTFLKQQLFVFLTLLIVTKSCFSPPSVNANNMPLTQPEIEQKIKDLPEWEQSEQQLVRTFTFKNFVEAIAFVDQLVEPAEAAGHHPDLFVSYNKVKVSLTTHDAGGLTEQDFTLAQTISDLAK